MGLFFLIQKKQLHLNNDPRIISVHILTKVLLKNQNLKEEFDAQVSCLNKRDRAFAKNLVYGVLRIKQSIDVSIEKYYQKSYKKLNEKHKNIFRIGIYQIDRMNSVPNYASVNTTVEIAKKESLKFSKRVNAILMNFIRNKDSLQKLSKDLTFNHPSLLIKQWQDDYTNRQISSLCKWNDSIPTVWFRTNKVKLKQIKKDKSVVVEQHPDIADYISFDDTKYAIDHFLKKDLIDVQSPSSGLVFKIMNLSKNDVIVDACSAPGGKAKYIESMMDSSNQLHLNDVSPSRYLRLKEDFKSNKVFITCKDAAADSFPVADKILLDVPCSSSGTIQKNPDIKWKKNNLDKINLLQFKILKNMSKFLNKNGVIVYSTCSINKKENFDIIEKFLKSDNSFKLEDVSNYINSKYVDGKGCLSIFPPKHNLEGMFAARLVKL